MEHTASRLQARVTLLFGLVTLLWALELFDLIVANRALDRLGIQPREAAGLWGILFAPFLHGSLAHLLANTVPLVILGGLVLIRGTLTFFAVSAITMLVGGLGVWLFGRPNSIHLGASMLIFGYLGYLLLRGYFERRFSSILLAIAVGLIYGGALWGLLPGQPGVSWEGHFFGFLGGVLAARLLTPGRERGRQIRPPIDRSGYTYQ